MSREPSKERKGAFAETFGPLEIYWGVVQDSKSGAGNCVVAKHEVGDLCVPVWNIVNELVE